MTQRGNCIIRLIFMNWQGGDIDYGKTFGRLKRSNGMAPFLKMRKVQRFFPKCKSKSFS